MAAAAKSLIAGQRTVFTLQVGLFEDFWSKVLQITPPDDP